MKNFYYYNPTRIHFGKGAVSFLPEELSYRAEVRYGNKGTSIRSLVLTTAICVLLFFLALTFIPVFVNMLDVTIGNVVGGL